MHQAGAPPSTSTTIHLMENCYRLRHSDAVGAVVENLNYSAAQTFSSLSFKRDTMHLRQGEPPRSLNFTVSGTLHLGVHGSDGATTATNNTIVQRSVPRGGPEIGATETVGSVLSVLMWAQRRTVSLRCLTADRLDLAMGRGERRPDATSSRSAVSGFSLIQTP